MKKVKGITIPVMLSLAFLILIIGYYWKYQPLPIASNRKYVMEENFQSTPVVDESCIGMTPVSNRCLPFPDTSNQLGQNVDCIQDKTCAIPPDNFNLYPKDLQTTIKKDNHQIECPEKNRLPICSSTNTCQDNYNSPYLVTPLTTPNVPDQSRISKSSELDPTCQQGKFSMYPFQN